MGVHIQTSEFGYLLIAELVTMPDRALAQKIELAIWPDSSIPNQELVDKLIVALEKSGCGSEFAEEARKLVA
jgi:hypothetical protein